MIQQLRQQLSKQVRRGHQSESRFEQLQQHAEYSELRFKKAQKALEGMESQLSGLQKALQDKEEEQAMMRENEEKRMEEVVMMVREEGGRSGIRSLCPAVKSLGSLRSYLSLTLGALKIDERAQDDLQQLDARLGSSLNFTERWRASWEHALAMQKRQQEKGAGMQWLQQRQCSSSRSLRWVERRVRLHPARGRHWVRVIQVS